jgi:hypothetical protein
MSNDSLLMWLRHLLKKTLGQSSSTASLKWGMLMIPESNNSASFWLINSLVSVHFILSSPSLEYIGSFLLEHVEVVWQIISPVLDLNNLRAHDSTTIISSGNAVISLLHEIPDHELHLEKVG